MTKKRRRPIHLHVMVSEAEQALIQERMAEAGIRNMGAYMRKMADRKSTRLNSSHIRRSRMPSSA